MGVADATMKRKYSRFQKKVGPFDSSWDFEVFLALQNQGVIFLYNKKWVFLPNTGRHHQIDFIFPDFDDVVLEVRGILNEHFLSQVKGLKQLGYRVIVVCARKDITEIISDVADIVLPIEDLTHLKETIHRLSEW